MSEASPEFPPPTPSDKERVKIQAPQWLQAQTTNSEDKTSSSSDSRPQSWLISLLLIATILLSLLALGLAFSVKFHG